MNEIVTLKINRKPGTDSIDTWDWATKLDVDYQDVIVREGSAGEDMAEGLRLVLDNDRELYDEVNRMVATHFSTEKPCLVCLSNADEVANCDHCKDGQVPRNVHNLGDDLRGWVEEISGVEGEDTPDTTLAILYAALPWIDWREVAQAYITRYLEGVTFRVEIHHKHTIEGYNLDGIWAADDALDEETSECPEAYVFGTTALKENGRCRVEIGRDTFVEIKPKEAK